MANFDKITATTFKHEGGFQNFPNDSANYCNGVLIGTNRGISAIAYKTYYGNCPTVSQMKALTVDQAKTIYKSRYWDKLQLDYVENDSVAAMMFQYIIGSGASQISDLKNIANQTAGKVLFPVNDISFTKEQAKAINLINQKKYWENLKAWRLNFYDRLVASNPEKYGMFLKGWQNRLNSYTYEDNFSKKKILIVSLIASLAVFSGLHFFYKDITMKQKIIVSISAGVIIYVGFQIYQNYKQNA